MYTRRGSQLYHRQSRRQRRRKRRQNRSESQIPRCGGSPTLSSAVSRSPCGACARARHVRICIYARGRETHTRQTDPANSDHVRLMRPLISPITRGVNNILFPPSVYICVRADREKLHFHSGRISRSDRIPFTGFIFFVTFLSCFSVSVYIYHNILDIFVLFLVAVVLYYYTVGRVVVVVDRWTTTSTERRDGGRRANATDDSLVYTGAHMHARTPHSPADR